jgi:hypothetical protein
MAIQQVKETIVTNSNQPQQVISKTVRQVTPAVVGEPPQKVYEKKKTIFRFNQVIWYILGFVEVLLAFRFILKILAANPYSGFTDLVYSLTAPLVSPFVGILGVISTGNSLIEWSTVIAMIVYLCLAWGLVYLLELFFPITPTDVGTE